MKHLLSLVLLVCSVSFSFSKNEAPVEAPVSVKMVKEGKALLRYKTAPESPLVVKVYNSENRLVKAQRLFKSSSFAKYYDFTNLGPGSYTFEVIENGKPSKRIPFQYEINKNEPIAFSSLKISDKNRIKLQFNALEPTDLMIFAYENGKLIHEEKLSNISETERLYRLKGISPTAELEIAIQTADGHKNRFKIN